jgi:Ser/Thr protein kinase RdoA (MazF antagonist)
MLRRRISAYSSSYTIENLAVELEHRVHLRLVFKDLGPASLLQTARRVRPPFLCDPLREIETYQRILLPSPLGTPRCYGAVVSPEGPQYWLFLERVDGPLLWQTGRIEVWEQAARWLACLHGQYADKRRANRLFGFAHLLRYDREYYGLWLKRAEAFLRQPGAAGSAEGRRRFGRLAGRYERLIRRLSDLPPTFIHGEFYPSNVILRRHGTRWRICPIDWEAAGIAPGLIDLAALTAGDWPQESKKRMVAAYRQALEADGRIKLSPAEMSEALDWCRLHLCVQWLGWAPDWSPPNQHARNWLREALGLAERLGL